MNFQKRVFVMQKRALPQAPRPRAMGEGIFSERELTPHSWSGDWPFGPRPSLSRTDKSVIALEAARFSASRRPENARAR